MGKANILVVDDEEDLLELVQFHLTREGYQVQRASTGEEALKKVKRDQFNLIVLDLMLPGIDGIEVAKALKAATFASRSGTPIEIVSKVIMRHAHLSTTQRYLGKDTDVEAMRWIENLHG